MGDNNITLLEKLVCIAKNESNFDWTDTYCESEKLSTDTGTIIVTCKC